ncbi:hypothetical protein [Afipia sp. Root123D2]|uniref:hypothetical protein n=1 Tax=Afipia sp. Root123D2 TaxID=1736436 RepID=UPI000AC1F047|nr:hypothetical protein [Afipia sp. Root123D2]
MRRHVDSLNHSSEDRRDFRVAGLLIAAALLAGFVVNCLGIVQAVSGRSFF